MTTVRTNLQLHEAFLRHLQTAHKTAQEDLARARHAVEIMAQLIEGEKDYLEKERACEPSKPSASDAAPTGS